MTIIVLIFFVNLFGSSSQIRSVTHFLFFFFRESSIPNIEWDTVFSTFLILSIALLFFFNLSFFPYLGSSVSAKSIKGFEYSHRIDGTVEVFIAPRPEPGAEEDKLKKIEVPVLQTNLDGKFVQLHIAELGFHACKFVDLEQLVLYPSYCNILIIGLSQMHDCRNVFCVVSFKYCRESSHDSSLQCRIICFSHLGRSVVLHK